MSREADQEAEKKPIPESTITTLKIIGGSAFLSMLGVAAFLWFLIPEVLAESPFILPGIVVLAFMDLGVFWYMVRQQRKHNANLSPEPVSAVQRTSR